MISARSDSRPTRILLTTGEPAGIGPDLCVLLAQESLDCSLTVIGDPELLAARAKLLGLSLEIDEINGAAEKAAPLHQPGTLYVRPVAGAADSRCGELRTSSAAYVLSTLDQGVRACLQGEYDALVTAPVHKGVINDAGIHFTGHTEYIASLTGGYPVMMLATEHLRVALATTHLPLAQVSAAITTQLLETVIRVLHADLRARFALTNPRILVCGLNPHAGEQGHLGREELDVINPVMDGLRANGMNLLGPLSADTLFLPRNLECADAVLAMYHDQGLPVLKYAGFGRAVNITLGLPIIRTSVDHGTALELAGTGKVETGSLEYAIKTATALVRQQKAAVFRLSLP
ncbi:4-hydroxythreonine-4-phosphate dehydrogenase PdxA [Candidatus Methylospira mobilis]|uniref:4-hydroxythreonine-4-phosphate dehydrogenase n=1 Tax=Candidatus Methylospira mobilis TaxID=1808979 RepID=A0A5Q0BEG6_9GAMM|nr:4-hydroxythreonine-4-phosphate dehydrogenase PdxA [Candidatus Methylospira mobilis]QFY41909.1 4-hydroxythreonine-4-phosphate dehydrogenase PdxA [Candidatus Methylospira mobilis]